MKCEVCGREYLNEEIIVCSSMFGATSFAFCEECLEAGREPYGAIVVTMVYYEEFRKEYLPYVDATLAFYKKTAEEYNADVDELIRDYNKACGEEKE